MTPCFINSKFAVFLLGKIPPLLKGPFGIQILLTSLPPQLGQLVVKCWKGFIEETMANCSQQFDLALCHTVSRHVFTQLVLTEVRAMLLHFHFQPSEMTVIKKKKVWQARGRQQPEQLVQFPAASLPAEFCGCSASDPAPLMQPKCWHLRVPRASLARDCLHIPPCEQAAVG